MFDRILGSGVHSIEARLHFHPDIQLNPLETGSTAYQVLGQTVKLVVECFGASASVQSASEDELSSWYAPRFGELLPIKFIIMRERGPLPLQLGYVFSEESTKVKFDHDKKEWNIVLGNQGLNLEIFVSSHGIRTRGSSEIIYEWIVQRACASESENV